MFAEYFIESNSKFFNILIQFRVKDKQFPTKKITDVYFHDLSIDKVHLLEAVSKSTGEFIEINYKIVREYQEHLAKVNQDRLKQRCWIAYNEATKKLGE